MGLAVLIFWTLCGCVAAIVAGWAEITERSKSKAETLITVGVMCFIFGPLSLAVACLLGTVVYLRTRTPHKEEHEG